VPPRSLSHGRPPPPRPGRSAGAVVMVLNSATGLDVTYHLSPSWRIDKSRATVVAPLHVSVGTTFAYSQLFIQPMKIRRPPVFDQVTPASSPPPSSSHLVSCSYGVNVFPSKSPTKYWVAEPPLGPPGLILPSKTHTFLPLWAKLMRPGPSHTPSCEPI